MEAAVELLIAHGRWLLCEDFLEIAVEFGQATADGAVLAAVDWEAAVADLDSGRLPCASSEGQILRLAAGIADGTLLDLRSALSGLDESNAALAAAAVLHAAGWPDRGWWLPAGGERP